jgi:hypothetical protein
MNSNFFSCRIRRRSACSARWFSYFKRTASFFVFFQNSDVVTSLQGRGNFLVNGLAAVGGADYSAGISEVPGTLSVFTDEIKLSDFLGFIGHVGLGLVKRVDLGE